MNILWLSHLVPYPPKGGVLQRSYNMLREVAKHHHVSLLAFNQPALIPDKYLLEQSIAALREFADVIGVVDIPCEVTRNGRTRMYLSSLASRQPFTANWLTSKEMQRQLEETVKSREIKLVHYDTISLARFSRYTQGINSVLNHHNIESHMMARRAKIETNPFYKFYVWQESLKLRSYEKNVCPTFDVNITCSLLDSDRLRQYIPDIRVAEIPNGVDLNYFHPIGRRPEAFSLVFAGGMNWYPNRDAMLFFAEKVWPRLKREMPDVRITVIGARPPETLVRMSQQDKNFIVTGYVDDVREYIDNAIVYVCPIKDGGGTKLKVLDALAMGKALVAHPVACEGIDVVDGETVLYAVHPEEYVNQIKRLFTTPALARKLGENGRRLIAERYSYAEIGRKLSDLYVATTKGQ